MAGGGGIENVRLDSTLAADVFMEEPKAKGAVDVLDDVFMREPAKENGVLDVAVDRPVPN